MDSARGAPIRKPIIQYDVPGIPVWRRSEKRATVSIEARRTSLWRARHSIPPRGFETLMPTPDFKSKQFVYAHRLTVPSWIRRGLGSSLQPHATRPSWTRAVGMSFHPYAFTKYTITERIAELSQKTSLAGTESATPMSARPDGASSRWWS